MEDSEDSIEKICERTAALERLKKRRFSAGSTFVNRLTQNSVEKRIERLKGQLAKDRKKVRKERKKLDATSDKWSLKEEVEADNLSDLTRRIRRLLD